MPCAYRLWLLLTAQSCTHTLSLLNIHIHTSWQIQKSGANGKPHIHWIFGQLLHSSLSLPKALGLFLWNHDRDFYPDSALCLPGATSSEGTDMATVSHLKHLWLLAAALKNDFLCSTAAWLWSMCSDSECELDLLFNNFLIGAALALSFISI